MAASADADAAAAVSSVGTGGSVADGGGGGALPPLRCLPGCAAPLLLLALLLVPLLLLDSLSRSMSGRSPISGGCSARPLPLLLLLLPPAAAAAAASTLPPAAVLLGAARCAAAGALAPSLLLGWAWSSPGRREGGAADCGCNPSAGATRCRCTRCWGANGLLGGRAASCRPQGDATAICSGD